MNILRHKSWHVRNRNNINRVKKDEEKARNEELEKEKRIALADSETRVHLLRQRLSANNGSDVKVASDANISEASATGTHLDIFQDFDDKIRTKNRDHEKEVKEEKEKFEKKTGILQYLVDKDLDSEHNWFLNSHEKRMKLTDTKTDVKYTEKELKDIKVKTFNDPIETMKRYLNLMKSKKDFKSDPKHKTNKRSIESVKISQTSEEIKSTKSKKHKKHKKKKRKRHSSESSDSDDNKVKEVSKTLEQLRAERLERERIERERTRALFLAKNGIQTEEVILDDRRRTYNSQFNPEMARQNLNNDK